MPTILVVEDHELSRDALARRLERRGYQVMRAVDGLEAVAIAQSASPHLILMDLGLPQLDGWAATRRLKSEAATRDIPIIVLSAHPQDRRAARAAGGDDVDAKPVHFAGLVEKIEALLNRQVRARD
jgi:two-component system, cell cycle response regulator DivK